MMTTTPCMSDTLETWGLERPCRNTERLEGILAASPTLIWRRDDLVLLRCGETNEGSFTIAVEDRIEFFARFKPWRRAVELRVWRSNLLSLHAVAREVIFEGLLREHSTVVSSQEVTASGREWWSKQIAAAAAMGMTVGIVDVSICLFPKSFHEWFHKQTIGAGARFFIDGRVPRSCNDER